MANKKQLIKEAKKDLVKDKRVKAIKESGEEKKSFIQDRVEFFKRVAELDKKEYESIEEDDFYPLTLASRYIPIKDIKDGIIETRNGRFLKILEVEPVNYDLKNEHEQNRIINQFEEFLKVAPSNMQIKCVAQKASMQKYTESIDRAKVYEKNEDALNFYEDHKNFVEQIARDDAIARKFYLVYQYEAGATEVRNREHAKKWLDMKADVIIRYLKKCGNEVCDIDDKPTHTQARIIYEILNREKAADIPLEINITNVDRQWEEINGEGTLDSIDIREYVSPQRIDFSNPDCTVVDGTYYAHMVITSNGYHEWIANAWTSLLTNMGEGIDVDFYITKKNNDDERTKIKQSAKINKIRLMETSDKNDLEPNNLEDVVDSSRYLLAGINNNQDFYYVNTMITITAETKEELDYKIKQIEDYLKSKEYKINKCVHMQEEAFYSYMPFCELNRQIYNLSKQNMLTTDLAGFYPFTAYELNNGKGVMFGISDANSSIVTLDNFDSHIYKNANMCILGTSGAGKTYTLQTIASRQRMNHIPVTIIAPIKGDEFYRVCKAWNGSFISISPSNDTCINVMEIRARDSIASKLLSGNVVESSLLVEKAQNLLIFFSLLIPDLTHEEKQLIDEAILETYNAFGITHDNASIYDVHGKIKTMPILGDLHVRLDEKPETKRVANILRRLVTGSARSFNQQTNVDLDNEYTVIDISNLTGDLLLVGMFIALEYVWSKAKEDKTKKKAIYIDECWELIGSASNELAAAYVLEIFKTIRGYGGSAVAATQDINDMTALADGKYGKGIINNSKIKIVLQLEADEAKAVQKSLNLTDSETEKIEEFDKGQAMLIANRNNIIVNVRASKLEHYFITTDRKELEQIVQELAEQYA